MPARRAIASVEAPCSPRSANSTFAASRTATRRSPAVCLGVVVAMVEEVSTHSQRGQDLRDPLDLAPRSSSSRTGARARARRRGRRRGTRPVRGTARGGGAPRCRSAPRFPRRGAQRARRRAGRAGRRRPASRGGRPRPHDGVSTWCSSRSAYQPATRSRAASSSSSRASCGMPIGAEEIRQAVVESRSGHVAERRPAVVPETTNGSVERGFVGRDRAALSRRHDLARVERETRRDAERAARSSAVLRAERAGGVLEEHDLLRHGGLQRLPLDRTPEEMHGHDGARSRRDRGGDGSDVEVERVGVDVDQNRLRAAQLDRVRRRRERVGGDDHLVARPDLEREQGEMERCRAGRDGRRVRRADGLRRCRPRTPRPSGPS